MNFSEVTYSDLSSITHKVLVAEAPRFATPEFKIIKFTGLYRHGASGANDALYIRAACESAHMSWWSSATILDFTEIDYQWGDDMQNVLIFGSDRVTKFQYSLAILVGDSCREALKSLLSYYYAGNIRNEYQEYCRDTLEEAIELARQKHTAYKEHMKNWHKSSEV